MLVAELQSSLIKILKGYVRNGAMTERGLARLVGISQPHMHNVLKGTRSLSIDLIDRVLSEMRLSVLDLIDREYLVRHTSRMDA